MTAPRNCTYDEANAQLTMELAGRTIDKIYREGLELIICTTCGKEVRMAATTDYHIVHKRTDTVIALQGVSMNGVGGQF